MGLIWAMLILIIIVPSRPALSTFTFGVDDKRRRTGRKEEWRMAKPLGPTGEFFRRRDEWRKHPMLTNNLRRATPGLGIALVAFGIYLVGEAAYNHFRGSDPHSTSHH
ncbi:unnamed protein product [Musa hybrid cultivar]